MTRQNFVRWTCNVCRASVESLSTDQPNGWVGYGFTETGTPAGEKEDVGHLCGDCYAAVEQALVERGAR